MTQEGGSDEYIKSRLGKARAAYSKLRKIWKSSQLKLKTKLKIFKSNVIAVLLYGCETWGMTKRDATTQDEFLHKNLRRPTIKKLIIENKSYIDKAIASTIN